MIDVLIGCESSVHMATPGPDRWKIRSKSFPGLRAVAADIWGRAASEYVVETQAA